MSTETRIETYDTYGVTPGSVIPDASIVEHVIKYIFPEVKGNKVIEGFRGDEYIGDSQYRYHGYYGRVDIDSEHGFACGMVVREELEDDVDHDDYKATMYMYVATGDSDKVDNKLSVWSVENNQCNLYNPKITENGCYLVGNGAPILGIWNDVKGGIAVPKMYIPLKSTLLVGKSEDVIIGQELPYYLVKCPSNALNTFKVFTVSRNNGGRKGRKY